MSDGTTSPILAGSPACAPYSDAGECPARWEGLATCVRERRHGLVLLLLLSIDAVFILLHVIHAYTGLLPGSQYSTETEGGYAEIYQHWKEVGITVLLLILTYKRFNWTYLSWALLFGYLFLDDSLEIHETVGLKFSNYVGFVPMFDLRARDFGELLFSASAGLIILLLVSLAYYLSDEWTRNVARWLVALLMAFACFAIVVDAGHQTIDDPRLRAAVGIFEDGGEMVVMSVLVWFVLCTVGSERQLAVRRRRLPSSAQPLDF